ncbi:uncharacterized protein TM35_000112640 [Trypanosoma theileri]|uniref:Uncharacterized protein n=1 Tax=Trypanosoma theileri TaxID=67003 RepID=A0A1X0P006_9TRYP|nr:uncharacterized protein TM35_000112640 [Trypanosoma theileri]ORC89730.1 hypothetical protein TM35_000112640 [Trypanosoma theileri]
MLAGLFYTRTAPQKVAEKPKVNDNFTVENPNGGNNKGNVLTSSEYSRPRSGNDFVENTSKSVQQQQQQQREQQKQPQMGKFISSTDVFAIEKEDSRSSSIKKQRKPELTLDFEVLVDKLKAILCGWLVRKRMKSNFALDLVKKIKSLDYGNSGESDFHNLEMNSSFRKSFYVDQLLSYLQNGIKTLINDDMKYRIKNKKFNLSYKESHDVKKNSSTSQKSQGLDFAIYSSDETKQRKEDLLYALKESTGLKDSSIFSLLGNITPNFLEERRSVFLQTIFSPEESREYFTPIPRFNAMKGFDYLDVNRSFTSMYGGGYHTVIKRLEQSSLGV